MRVVFRFFGCSIGNRFVIRDSHPCTSSPLGGHDGSYGEKLWDGLGFALQCCCNAVLLDRHFLVNLEKTRQQWGSNGAPMGGNGQT